MQSHKKLVKGILSGWHMAIFSSLEATSAWLEYMLSRSVRWLRKLHAALKTKKKTVRPTKEAVICVLGAQLNGSWPLKRPFNWRNDTAFQRSDKMLGAVRIKKTTSYCKLKDTMSYKTQKLTFACYSSGCAAYLKNLHFLLPFPFPFLFHFLVPFGWFRSFSIVCLLSCQDMVSFLKPVLEAQHTLLHSWFERFVISHYKPQGS